MAKQMLFEYVLIHHPRQTKEDRDAGVQPPSQVLGDVKRVLAKDASEVNILAAREIPQQFLDRLDTIEIGVRPF